MVRCVRLSCYIDNIQGPVLSLVSGTSVAKNIIPSLWFGASVYELYAGETSY